MASQPGLQTVAIQILANISQSQGNQKMKFGHLIERNKREIFLQKIIEKMRQGNWFQTSFYFSKKLSMR